ncbi:TPA: NupC/NupG family nucleoside CNT transporter [Staphylococcus aureus]|nr:NupC/NupG family nucleoside CNT transporter [Staphylococcus aureus]HDI7766758.1 NupC/NupG family nucleoside CNT transporter [Staphylococcus aureus]HDI7800893.1 NupC/NupG family nucleoside CNT transporter [Staphylococcus aureus]
MHILIGIIGIIFFIALAFLFSSDRKNIRWKYVGILLAIQLIFAFILLKTTMGIKVIGGISNGFNYLLLKAADGVNFVFGGIQYIDPKQRLYTLTASAMSTVSASIIGAYFTLIEPKYVVTAVVLNLFGGFIIASIINPYKVNEEDDKLLVEETEERQQSFFEMLGEYILDGFKVAVIVGAMLIGYIAIIALLNGIVSNIFSTVSGGAISWDFQTLIGFVFAPFAFLVGVPWQDAVQAGSVMATKLLSNEFVAMQALGKLSDLSEHAKGVTSVFLVSFANFSSIGIISGAIKSLNDKKGDTVARFGLKLLFGATLVSFISAAIAGFFI